MTRSHIANIKTKINKTRTARKRRRNRQWQAATSSRGKPAKNADTITLDQVKKVAQTIRTMGGFSA